MALVATFKSSGTATAGLNVSFTFDCGAAAADKIAVIGLHQFGGVSGKLITAITVDGINCLANVTQGQRHAAVWCALPSSSGVITVNLTYDNAPTNFAFGAWTVTGSTGSPTDTQSTFNGADASRSVTLTIPTGGIGLATATGGTGATATTITNATADYDARNGATSLRYSGAHTTTTGSVSPTFANCSSIVGFAFTPAADALFGWFEQVGKPSPNKPPQLTGAFAWTPVNFTAKTPSDLGWFEPYPKRPPETKGPGSSVAWDPRVIAAAQTLTTSIGWFEPYARPLAKSLPPFPAWVSVFGFRPDLGVGWFELYAQAPSPRARAPQAGQPFVSPIAATPVAPSFGWCFSFSLAPRKQQAAPSVWAIELGPLETAPVPQPDCGHLSPSIGVGADLAPGQSQAGGMRETLTISGTATASLSVAGKSRASVSKGGSLKSEITCR